MSSFDTYPPGDIDFKTQFAKISAEQPTALILYSLAGDCPTAYKQLKEANLKVQLFLPVQSFACGTNENTLQYANLLIDAYGSDIVFDDTSTAPLLSCVPHDSNSTVAVHLRWYGLRRTGLLRRA